MSKLQAMIIGSGNIGTDLMLKIQRRSDVLSLAAMVGIDPQSEGLAIAGKSGIQTTHGGFEAAQSLPEWQDVQIVFDATSAAAHHQHDAACRAAGKQMIDLTPAAIGPFCVPVVNMDAHIREPNVSMVSCGGQATTPMVYAVSRVAKSVAYAEIVASISSYSAGPGTRANIDEFTQTTASALEKVGGAQRGKAIIVLNPAKPPVLMRNTVYTLSQGADIRAIEQSAEDMLARVQTYVPGYRLKQKLQFEEIGHNEPLNIPGLGYVSGLKTTIFIEVEGAGHFLPSYSGNLDIMTSAALATAEQIAKHKLK